jgi:hypothetical protein
VKTSRRESGGRDFFPSAEVEIESTLIGNILPDGPDSFASSTFIYLFANIKFYG